MSKGNQIPISKPKKIGIAELDTAFSDCFKPLDKVSGWNNTLDKLLCQTKAICADIMNKSDDGKGKKEIGKAKLNVDENGLITVKVYDIENEDQEITKLPKGTTERVKMVTKKAKMLHSKRLAQLRKQGDEYKDATFAIDDEDEFKVKLTGCDVSAIEDTPVVEDLQRSLTKFNDRVSVLNANLKGVPTLAEGLSAMINDAKAFVAEKKASLGAVIENGVPKFNISGIDNIPEKLEDFFPDLIRKAWALLNRLIDFIKDLFEKIPSLDGEIKQAIETAKELPGKVKELASNLDPPPGPKQLFQMAKAAKDNLSKVSSAPSVVSKVSATMKETATSLCESAESATKQ